MKLVVDGVFFQLTYSGIARLWSSILPRLATVPELNTDLLDRGNCPAFDGIERVEFPSIRWTQIRQPTLCSLTSIVASSVPRCFHQQTIRRR